jgi:hypothetical protein
MHYSVQAVIATVLLAMMVIPEISRTLYAAPGPDTKPRVIVLTDISNEPDDEESIVRFLVYSNEYDVEGLIATTSCWLRDTTRVDLIQRNVNAYGQVRKNLLVHAEGFPEAARLQDVIRVGQSGFGMLDVGPGRQTEGSRHIIEVVDRPDPRPVWVSVWGGANTLAQALWDVKYTRSAEQLAEFVSKLRVYTISDQDDSGRWLRITFPDLYFIVSPSRVGGGEYQRSTWSGISGDRFYDNGPWHRFELVDNPWLTKNIIKDHGPLGRLYPKHSVIMEGDTPSYLNLINNGLGSHLSPTYGGWGGRYRLFKSYAETRPIYTNDRDKVVAEDGSMYRSDQATIWRWREAFQYDFAARMDWCTSKEYSQANHNPIAVLGGVDGKGIVTLEANAGDTVRLTAEGSTDPDGDRIEQSWFQYREAGTCREAVELFATDGPVSGFVAPSVERECTVHVILTVKDNGEPSLVSYRRAIVTVKP